MSYLFGFSGRINRAKMWLFLLVTLAWEIVIGVFAVIGTGGHTAAFHREVVEGTSHTNIGAALNIPGVTGTKLAWVFLAVAGLLAVLYIVSALAVCTKRLHDRDRSAWWLIAFVVIPCVVSALQHTPVPDVVTTIEQFNPLGLGYGVAALAGTILGIWGFLELFVFRGTIGENRYGPDPLPPPPPAA